MDEPDETFTVTLSVPSHARWQPQRRLWQPNVDGMRVAVAGPYGHERVTAWQDGADAQRKNTAGGFVSSGRARAPDSAVISMPQIDARGFLGLFGRTVLAVRAQYQGASAAVPAYAQPLLGGIGSVRGHRVGARAGDKLAAASAELRFPLSSPLRFGMLGLRVFFDTGATYNANERLGQTQFSHGAGAGVFLNAAFLTLQLDAAKDLRGGARLHFATGVSF